MVIYGYMMGKKKNIYIWLVVEPPTIVDNILLIMVNDDGYYMVNDG